LVGGHLFDGILYLYSANVHGFKSGHQQFCFCVQLLINEILHQAKFDSLRIRTRLGVGAFV
jgi:hypothetical protein